MELQNRIEQLFVELKTDWLQLNSAIQQLSETKTKQLSWGDNNNVTIQLNPNVPAHISEKDNMGKLCMLCESNRPKWQKGIEFTNKYIILPNQYPILNNHITIALHSHVLQRIRKKIGDMLSLAEALPNYIITYDDAQSNLGTETEHFHFQAGLKSEVLMQGDNELRTCLVIECDSISDTEENFEDVYYYLSSRQPDIQEPMMNIIAFIEKDKYVLHVFPRKLGNHIQYHQMRKSKLITTPSAIEMAGLMTISNKEDYDNIRKEDIEDIYSQISMSII